MRAIKYIVMFRLLACVLGCTPPISAETDENTLSHAYLPGRTLLLSDELTMSETRSSGGEEKEISTTLGFDLKLDVSKSDADDVHNIQIAVCRIWIKAKAGDESHYMDTAKPETMKNPQAESMPNLVGAVYASAVDATGKIAEFTTLKAPGDKLDGAREMAPIFRSIVEKVFFYVPGDEISVGQTWKTLREYMCFPLSISFGRITEKVECKLVKISDKEQAAPTIHVSISGSTAPNNRHPAMGITGSIVYRKKSKDLVSYKTKMSLATKGQKLLVTNTVVLTEE